MIQHSIYLCDLELSGLNLVLQYKNLIVNNYKVK